MKFCKIKKGSKLLGYVNFDIIFKMNSVLYYNGNFSYFFLIVKFNFG